jgi:dTMP kinase
MQQAGNLFVFEGADGAGKSSIAGEAMQFLGKRGIDIKILAFPGNLPNTLGNLVYKIHHAPESLGIEKLTPTSLQTLHIAAHLDAIERTIVPTLQRGGQIILDRYWWSTWVYGLVGGMDRDLLNNLIEVERIAWGNWKPAGLFYITRKTPLREEPKEKWQMLKSAYEELLALEKNKYPIQIIHNESTPKAALNEILENMTSILKC